MTTTRIGLFRSEKLNDLLEQIASQEQLINGRGDPAAAPVSDSIAALEEQALVGGRGGRDTTFHSNQHDSSNATTLHSNEISTNMVNLRARERVMLSLLIRLISECCTETVEVLQNQQAAWSHYCLVFRPGLQAVAEAEQIVRVAKSTLSHPLIAEYLSTQRAKAVRLESRDASLALRLKSVWLELCVYFAEAAVAYAKQRPRQALGHAEKGVQLLQWATDNGSPELLPSVALRMVMAGSSYTRGHGGGGGGSVAEVSQLWSSNETQSQCPRSFAAQAVVSMVTSYAVYLYHCEKYEQALSFAELSCTIARGLQDEVTVAADGSALYRGVHRGTRRSAVPPSPSSRFGNVEAELLAVKLLLSLCAVNLVMIQQGLVLADGTRQRLLNGRRAAGLLERCSPVAQKRNLDMASNYADTVLGPTHPFTELVRTMRQRVATTDAAGARTVVGGRERGKAPTSFIRNLGAAQTFAQNGPTRALSAAPPQRVTTHPARRSEVSNVQSEDSLSMW